MNIPILTRIDRSATRYGMRRTAVVSMMAGAVGLAGCVQVSAPEEPIVIELNINVEQTIDVNLREDVQNLIEDNPELFPE